MIETEYKQLMEMTAFYRLKDCVRQQFPDAQVKDTVQVNDYYDTADGFLRSQDITLRIRHTEEGLWLQSKAHFVGTEAFRRSEEHGCLIASVPNSLRLTGFPGRRFLRQGNLVTRRTRFLLENGLRLDFDVNYYEGVTDYELEVEFRPDEIERSRQVLEQLGLEESSPGDGKATRFFAAKNRRAAETVEMDLGFAGWTENLEAGKAAAHSAGQTMREGTENAG